MKYFVWGGNSSYHLTCHIVTLAVHLLSQSASCCGWFSVEMWFELGKQLIVGERRIQCM